MPDPQLHQHNLIINAGKGTDGKWRALDSTQLYELSSTAYQVFQEDLRSRLEKNLGIITEKDGNSFAVVGVPQEVCTFFSKRSQQVAQEKERLREAYPGISEKKLSDMASITSRSPKQEVAELFPYWKKEAEARHFCPYTTVYGEAQRQRVQEIAALEEGRAQATRAPLAPEQIAARARYQEMGERFERAMAKVNQREYSERKLTPLDAFPGSKDSGSHTEPPQEQEVHTNYWGNKVYFTQGTPSQTIPRSFTTTTPKLTRTTLSHWIKDYAATHPDSVISKVHKTLTSLREESKWGRSLNAAQEQIQKQKRDWLEVKRALGLVDKRTYLKAKGEYYQPTNKLVHAALEATGKISHKYRTWLDQQLEVEKLRRTKDSSILVPVHHRLTSSEHAQVTAISIQTNSTIYYETPPIIKDFAAAIARRQQESHVAQKDTQTQFEFKSVHDSTHNTQLDR